MEQIEIWKDIPEYEGMYQVSNLGNVKSLKKGSNKILKKCFTTTGYYYVNLYKNKHNPIKVHQLVAMAFLNHKRNGFKVVVDHIDNNILNNKLDNLQLLTNRENCSKDKKNKSSKYTGVSYIKKHKKFMASIQINKKNYNLGYFENEYNAHLAYQNKLKEIK